MTIMIILFALVYLFKGSMWERYRSLPPKIKLKRQEQVTEAGLVREKPTSGEQGPGAPLLLLPIKEYTRP